MSPVVTLAVTVVVHVAAETVHVAETLVTPAAPASPMDRP